MKTRRALAVMLTALLAIALLAPSVLAAEEMAEDSFEAISYSGGSGWNGPWTETGESTNPSSGVIRVVSSGCVESNCVRFSTLLTLGDYAVSRTTDVSGAESVTLSFTYKRGGVGILELWTRSGSSDPWTQRSLNGGTGGFTAASFDITADAGSETEIRFNMSLLSLTASAYVDNVSITANYPPPSSTTTTTTTSSTTTSSTTTTTEPIITVPTIPPLLTTTTTTTSAASSSTTTTEATTTTTTPTSPGSGGGGSGGGGSGGGGTGPEASGADPSSGDGDQATVNPPLTEDELDLAAESNIIVNLAGEGDFGGFEPGIGINPMTDLWVNLNTTVEAISTEILSALALGAMIAFFGVRRVKDEEDAS